MIEVGTQIVYVPHHANWSALEYPPCEVGFVTSCRWIDDYELRVWCRFWYPDLDNLKLRTKANSESVDSRWLIILKHIDDEHVRYVLDNLDETGFYVGERYK